MLKFVIKRLVSCFFVLIAVSFLSFIVLNLAPGDTAETILTHTFIGFDDVVLDEDVQTVSQMYNLSSPLVAQYWGWLKEAMVGNWGTSYVHHVEVWFLILSKIPYTLLLGLLAFFFAFIISVPLGLYVATKRNGAADQIFRIITILFGSIPGFWLALVMIIIFCVKLNWLPITGIGSPLNTILPCFVLMVGMIPTTFRITRSSMCEVMSQDYMLTAKSKGLGEAAMIRKHALVNVLPTVITMSGLEIGHILGGSVIIETIFVWPGIGKLLYDSILARDLPMIQGCIVTISLGYIVSMFLVDVINAYIDPRFRLGGGKN